jgi:tetratricopeptide (TPR) repeat protein
MRHMAWGLAVFTLLAAVAGADWNAGVAAYQKKDWQTALAEFEGVVKQNPTFAGGHFMLGRVLSQLGRNDEALKAFREAVRLEPTNAGYAVAAAQAMLEKGLANDAAAALSGVTTDTLKPAQKAAVLTAKGQVALAQGNSSQAIEFGKQATHADANNAEAWGFLGSAYSRADRNSEAFEAYRRGFELSGNPTLGKNAVAAGTRAARLASGQQKRALYDAVAAVATKLAEKRGGPEGALMAAEALLGAQDFDNALKWLDRSGLDNALVLYYRGQCYLGKDNLGEAEGNFRKALAKGPQTELRRQIYTSLGFVLDKAKRYQEAAQAYEQAGNASKVAEMRNKQSLAEQNKKADDEAARLKKLEELQRQYQSIGGAPTPPPTR